MGLLEWMPTNFTRLISVGGAACTFILPVLILGGIGYFLYERNQQSTAFRQAAQSWPGTSGRVLSSTIKVTRSARSRSEIPVVVDQYQVNGKDCQNQIVRAGEQYLCARFAGQARETVKRYAPGTKATGYFNPVHPAESTLER